MNDWKKQFRDSKLRTEDLIQKINAAAIHEVYGRVAGVRGDFLQLEGMAAPVGAICCLDDVSATRLRIIGLSNRRLIAAPLDPIRQVSAGDKVRLLDFSVKVRVGDGLCGRVIDAFGHSLDKAPKPLMPETVDVDFCPEQTAEAGVIQQTFQTGVRAIDALLTYGQGQRIGVLGETGVGKTNLLRMMARGTRADRIVFALIGQRSSELGDLTQRSLDSDSLARSVVVASSANAPAAQKVLAAKTAVAISEYFRARGDDVLLLMDSMNSLAMAFQELGRAASQAPISQDLAPGVANQLLSLVERSGSGVDATVTSFFSLSTGDHFGQLLTDSVLGTFDGHVTLCKERAVRSQWPAIDLLSSDSRFRENPVFAQAGQFRRYVDAYQRNAQQLAAGNYRAGTDPDLDRAIALRGLMDQFLMQTVDQTVSIEQSQSQLLELLTEHGQAAA